MKFFNSIIIFETGKFFFFALIDYFSLIDYFHFKIMSLISLNLWHFVNCFNYINFHFLEFILIIL